MESNETEEMELPECPVCLQTYCGESTVPRVLACGHSACESCLLQLPKPFPNTIHCPSCTVLVKYPHSQGPSALPRNIDLLRLVSFHQKPKTKPNSKPKHQTLQVLPHSWSDEFYANWKDRVIPNDAVLIEERLEDDRCTVIQGKITTPSSSSFPAISCIKKNQSVSLLQVGTSSSTTESALSFSYVARIMRVLSGMCEKERDELGLILRASSRQIRLCKVFGLWFDLKSGSLYLVCEKHNRSMLRNCAPSSGIVGEDCSKVDTSSFVIIGAELCEAVISLHLEQLVAGCLTIQSFDCDNFGHPIIDPNEILVTGRKLHHCVAEAVCGKGRIGSPQFEVVCTKILKSHAYISPELLFELLQTKGITTECDSLRYPVGYSSDVWSVACVLLEMLIGKSFYEETFSDCQNLLEMVSDHSGWTEKITSLLVTSLGTEFATLQTILCKCLDLNPENRPLLIDVWKCFRGFLVKTQFDIMISLEKEVVDGNRSDCLVLGELCQLSKKTGEATTTRRGDDVGTDVDQVCKITVEMDLVEAISVGDIRCIDLKGHLDCITGFAVGGGYLFSSSFDKTICVWSLKDFAQVHRFRGHEHKIMATIVVHDEEQKSFCISSDSGCGIFIWDLNDNTFNQEPLKKWYEEKDWRYSGIHALAAPGNGYVYTGSGDKSIKAWSLKDGMFLCSMVGHKSVVSSLAVSDGVLYSGSWDGSIRLWSLVDHSLLTVLEEGLFPVSSVNVDNHMLVAADQHGCLKLWKNDVLKKSVQTHDGSIFAVSMEGKWLFTGGWDRTVHVQELSGDEFQIDLRPLGSIACDSVVTALLYSHGKLFVGCADKSLKVYRSGQ